MIVLSKAQAALAVVLFVATFFVIVFVVDDASGDGQVKCNPGNWVHYTATDAQGDKTRGSVHTDLPRGYSVEGYSRGGESITVNSDGSVTAHGVRELTVECIAPTK